MKIKSLLKNFCLVIFSLGIPGLLILNGIQSSKYRELKKEVLELEKKQEKLIAENDLGMRKAETEEIVRVEMRKNERK